MAVIRSATLTVLLLALAARAAHGAATCPSAASSSSINCYTGATFSGTLPAGGECTCKCGATAAVADYDYSGEDDTTQFLATSSAGCTNALCTSRFPKGCIASGYVNASYITAAQLMAAAAPVSVLVGTGAICVTYTQTCTVANPCATFLTTGALSQYIALAGDDGMTAKDQCAADTAFYTPARGYTWNSICTTNNCNAPGASSAAAGALNGITTVASMTVAALAIAAM